jgi:hypothetical protein
LAERCNNFARGVSLDLLLKEFAKTADHTATDKSIWYIQLEVHLILKGTEVSNRRQKRAENNKELSVIMMQDV